MFLGRVSNRDFEALLKRAIDGDVTVDHGMTDDLHNVLTRIAESDDPPEQLIALARKTWEEAKELFPNRFID